MAERPWLPVGSVQACMCVRACMHLHSRLAHLLSPYTAAGAEASAGSCWLRSWEAWEAGGHLRCSNQAEIPLLHTPLSATTAGLIIIGQNKKFLIDVTAAVCFFSCWFHLLPQGLARMSCASSALASSHTHGSRYFTAIHGGLWGSAKQCKLRAGFVWGRGTEVAVCAWCARRRLHVQVTAVHPRLRGNMQETLVTNRAANTNSTSCSPPAQSVLHYGAQSKSTRTHCKWFTDVHGGTW